MSLAEWWGLWQWASKAMVIVVAPLWAILYLIRFMLGQSKAKPEKKEP